MIATADQGLTRPRHPIAAVLVAGAMPLFLGGLLSDIAYSSSYQPQWANFASWLIAGALVFAGFALLWALIDLMRTRGRMLLPFLVLSATWILGLVDALVHAKDAWAIMPAGLVLSVIVTLLSLVAVVMAFAGFRSGGSR